MRVDYMLPGLFPQANPELTRASAGEPGVSYPTLPLSEAPILSWREMLGLSRQQAGVPALRAQASTSSLSRTELRDRLQSALGDVADQVRNRPADPKPLEAAQAMFKLLLHYENLADQLIHQTLTERRG